MSCCIEIPQNVNHDCIQSLQDLVSLVRNFIANQSRRRHADIELEIRLGSITDNGSFCTDIGETSWTRIMSAMDASSDWTQKYDMIEIVDFFYSYEIDGVPENIRTSRYVKDGKIVCDHQIKKSEKKCTVGVLGTNLLNAFRVAFNTETTVDVGALPEITSTTCVRIKHRKSYQWNNWRYDLTKIWSAPTYAGATRLRDDVKNSHTKYEIEMELVQSEQYFSRASHTDEYIAVSILLKVIGLLPKHIEIGHRDDEEKNL